MDHNISPYQPPASSEVIQEISGRFSSPESSAAKELLGWSRLGILVLAIAGIMALLVAASRIPGIEKFSGRSGSFKKGSSFMSSFPLFYGFLPFTALCFVFFLTIDQVKNSDALLSGWFLPPASCLPCRRS
jgi:hypothetical protein